MLELFSLTNNNTGGSHRSPRSSPCPNISHPPFRPSCPSDYYATLMAQYLSTHRIAGLCVRANHLSNNDDRNNNHISHAAMEENGGQPLEGYIKNEGLDKDKDKGADQGKGVDSPGCLVREGVFDDTLLTMTEPSHTADW